MKLSKKIFSLALIFTLVLTLAIGCSNDDASEDPDENPDTGNGESIIDEDFTYSTGLDENGFWEGITALDYVTLPDYMGIEVPEDVTTVSDEALQNQIDGLLNEFMEEIEVTNRDIEDGDKVNIDYVGKVDGETFEGGDTQGEGTDVIVGQTNYIDDFIEQLIGKTPGDTYDIEVTFPEDYGQDDLNGKDAVFTTTINYIVEEEKPELTDQFVVDNLGDDFGYSSVSDMEESVRSDMKSSAISNYLQSFLIENSEISEVPESIKDYSKNNMLLVYQEQAAQYGMSLEEFLKNGLGVESVDDLFDMYEDQHIQNSNMFLVMQAIAEDAEITVSEEDMSEYFSNQMGVDDFSQLEEHYGGPYLKLNVLHATVLEMVEENAVLE
ncbi:MAG: trigger factor [Clostridia bacterium]